VTTPTAPLDPEDVRACLSGTGTMLPAPAYVDPAVLAWERRVLFAGGWVCAARAADIAEPRQRRAVRVGDDSVLLVRGEDGVLRGFYNTCRHRAHELLPCASESVKRAERASDAAGDCASESVKRAERASDAADGRSGSAARGPFITCPYHSWVYDLRGRLHKVPPVDRDVLDAGDIALIPAAVRQWHGFVFVNADAAAPPLDTYLAGLGDLLDPYDCDRLVVAASHTYELAANWKLAVENYHECYHCSTIHPELCRVSPPDSGDNFDPAGLWAGGTMDLAEGVETMALDGRSGGVPIPGLPAPLRRRVTYVQAFPNLLVSAHPDYVMTHLLEPLAPDRTRVVCQWLFPPEALDRAGFDPSYAVDFWDLTNRQDWAACEAVQRGLGSRGYRPGPLSPSTENVVFQAIAVVARAYLDGRLPTSMSVTALEMSVTAPEMSAHAPQRPSRQL
jgi:glycine betaine catabolism A